MYWRIFPPSMGEFAETSGKLTMRDGQSAAIVVLQVSVLLIAVMPFAVCVCVVGGWGGGRWSVLQSSLFCLYDRYIFLNVQILLLMALSVLL